MTKRTLNQRHKGTTTSPDPRKGLSPWMIWVVGLPAAALIGGLVHLAGHGPFHALTESAEQEGELEEEIDQLEQENELLQEDIDALTAGEFGIEKRAREQLGWSKPGEIVVHIPHKK